MTSRFTDMVGCALPIQQAPMGGVASAPQLPVAVAAAGGMGMLSAVMQSAERLATVLDGLPAAAIGVNFLVPFVHDRDVVSVAAARMPLVDFFGGEPDPELVALVHAEGSLAEWQVGSVEEARAAVAAGCDLVVAQGVEAGGHVRGTLGLLALLDLVLGAVEVPVVAAGGLATARSVAAVLAAGAAAARVGTRFIATHEALEAGAHRVYVDALLSARGEETVLTEAFSVGWPSAPHRVLTSCVEAASASSRDPMGEMTLGDQTFPVPHWAVMSPNVTTVGEIAAMALYAGQGVGAVDRIESAADVVAELTTLTATAPR